MHFYVIFPSGDPTRDMEYSDYNLSRRTDFIIPEPIRNFLPYFQKVVRDLERSWEWVKRMPRLLVTSFTLSYLVMSPRSHRITVTFMFIRNIKNFNEVTTWLYIITQQVAVTDKEIIN